MLLSLQKHVDVAHRGQFIGGPGQTRWSLEVFSRLDDSIIILHVSPSVLGVGELAQALFAGG